MRLYEYEIYGRGMLGMQYTHGIVQAQDNERAEEYLREIYSDELTIQWILLSEIVLDEEGEEHHIQTCSYHDSQKI